VLEILKKIINFYLALKNYDSLYYLRCTPKHEKIKLIVLLGKHLILYMSRVLKAPIENWCDASFDTLNYGVHKTRAPHGRPTS
jgi:hypothetical protein